MRQSRTTSILKAALVAGLISGFATGVYHFIFTEPVIEEALLFEEVSGEPPVVTRQGQLIGLVTGSVILGIAIASVFGLVFSYVQRILPGSTTTRKTVFLTIMAFVAVFLIPSLKYPANPPAVGDPETIFYRQSLFLGFQITSVFAISLGFALYKYAKKQRQTIPSILIGLGTFLLIGFGAYIVYPVNPDAITIPAELVARFRLVSIGGQTLMWLLMGLAFGWVWKSKPRVRRIETPVIGNEDSHNTD